MVRVAVAGGTSGLGRLVVNAIMATKKHDVFVLSRKDSDIFASEPEITLFSVDYAVPATITAVLEENRVDTVVSCLHLNSKEASDSQLNLIEGAARASSVERFAPSEFGLDYLEVAKVDLDFHAVAFKVAAIDKLKEFPSLKYIRFITGTFMDFFGPPPNPPQVNVISIIIDPENAKAAIPGDGSSTILITHTTDVARFVAAALSLPDWPEKLIIQGDRLTLNEVVAVAESVKGSKFDITYTSVNDLKAGKSTELPSNIPRYAFLPKPIVDGITQTVSIGIVMGLMDIKGACFCAEMTADTYSTAPKPVVLHIGDPILYNEAIYARFCELYTVIRPSTEERQRPEFIKALKENRWGDFNAIFRPYWSTGGEMGKWDAELISCLPQGVRVFASAGAGYDWADVEELANHGIIYCNSAAACTESVADFALFGILSTFRQLSWCTTAAVDPTSFTRCHLDATALSRNPRGHVLGVIGLGNIGQAIAAKAFAAFKMRILYYDINRKCSEVEAQSHAAFVPTLQDLVHQSDCVIVATPASPDGKVLVNGDLFKHFKKGARLINVARGNLVDEERLADAIDSGHIKSAMLDVHTFEPKVNERLKNRREVMLTCHNAGGTVDTHIDFERLSMENIEAVLSRAEMPNSAVNAHLFSLDI
ncbi:hypothetical protein V494_02898 [Pseudogymnoascus sp. VKM F-4513 (FW-928)]|nr:hypothetical protein V494_02898 [Pseudogymnoascus sp. VKM F-4513 (FW-928)]